MGGVSTLREEVLLLSALATLCVVASCGLLLVLPPLLRRGAGAAFPRPEPPRVLGRSARRLVLFLEFGRWQHAASVNATGGGGGGGGGGGALPSKTIASKRWRRPRVPGVSLWWAAPGEGVWPEGRLDAYEAQRVLERKQRKPIPDASIAALRISGTVADQLKLTGRTVLRPPSNAAAKQAVHGTPFFEGDGIRLGKSSTLGDPYWYLSRGKGPVKGPGNPTILAYVEGRQKCPPWHAGCEYSWWAHPNGGTWIRYPEEELLFDASDS